MEILLPHLEKKEWKLVNLNEAYKNSEQKLNMHDIIDQYTLLNDLSNQKQVYTYGGFGEDRSDLWHGFEPDAKKMIHLGVDINNLKVGQPVCSLSDGTVVDVLVDPSSFNGWGGRVIIKATKNILGLDEPIYFLYGHLQSDGLPEKNTTVKLGDVIGKIAAGDSNGGWFEHLHLQIMRDCYVQRFRTYREIDGYDFHSTEILKELIDPIEVLNKLC